MLLGDPIIYWTLRIILVAILFISGWGISHNDGKDPALFWKWTLPSIVAYSLIEGLRWNRGQDYYHYYQDLTGQLFTDYNEPLYLLWIDFFKFTGLPYWVAFVFYSFLLILGVVLLVKLMPRTAVWVLPLFYIITESSAENLIRQYLAVPFILYAIYYYFIGNKKKMWLSLVCCPLIHLAGLYAALLFLLFTNISFKYRKWIPWCVCGLYLYLYYLFDVSSFSYLTSFIEKLNLDEGTAFSNYTMNAERWFTDEGSIANVLGQGRGTISFIAQTASFLSNIIIIFGGYWVIKEKPGYTLFYWFSVFAVLIQTIGGDIEMYQRFVEWTIYLLPFVIGLMFTAIKSNKFFKKYHVVFMIVLMVNYVFYGFIRAFGSMPYSGCAFIWDA